MDPWSREQNSASPPWEARQIRTVPYVQPSPPHIDGSQSRAQPTLPRLQPETSTPAQYTSPISTEVEYRPWQASGRTLPSYKSTPDFPPNMHHAYRAPPTPPDSVAQAVSRSHSRASADHKSLPGTMSAERSRERSQSSHCGRRPPAKHHIELPKQKHALSLDTRFKTAMKTLFHRSPVNPSNCESLQVRHWTEEDI